MLPFVPVALLTEIFCHYGDKNKLSLKGLCHGILFNFANYSPSIAMELKVSKEITRT